MAPITGPGKTDAEAGNCKMRGGQMGHMPCVVGAEEATLQESPTGLGYLASPSLCMHTLLQALFIIFLPFLHLPLEFLCFCQFSHVGFPEGSVPGSLM